MRKTLPCLLLAVLPVFAVAAEAPKAVAKPAAPAAAAKPVPPAAATTGVGAARPETVRVLIVPSREAKLSATMDGKLVALPRNVGQAFRRGESLAEFECSTQRAELSMAAARLDKAQRTLDSQQSLSKLNAASELDLASAKADVAEARARHDQAQALVDKCVITAPYNGRVVRRLANQFETLPAGSPVLEIVETGTLRMEMLVPSKWMRWLKVGKTFTVHVDELDRDVGARVTGLGSRVDPVSQTVTVLAEITQHVEGVLPGMSGNALIGADKP